MADALGAVGPSVPQERKVLAETNARGHRWIAESGRQQREVVRWGYRRLADLRMSATDPDASPMQHKKGAARLGYLTHYVVDGAKARVILDALVTPAGVTENLPMLELALSGAASDGAVCELIEAKRWCANRLSHWSSTL